MASIERRREQVLNQILNTCGIPTSGPVPNFRMDVRRAAIELVCEKRMTRNILDRIEDLMLNLDTLLQTE